MADYDGSVSSPFRIATAGAELWRIAESIDRETTAVKEADVEDIKRSLIAAGWREL